MAASDTFRDYFITEFVDDYKEGHLTRRETLKRLIGLTGSLAAANALIAACAPAAPAVSPAAPTATAVGIPTVVAGPGVSPDDPDLVGQNVDFPGPAGTLLGYIARPRGDGPFPAVLVCHENQGLLPHFPDVCRRYAKAGYVALAVDLLSREGGTDKIPDSADRVKVFGTSDPQRFVQDFQAGLLYLRYQAFVQKARIGMMGFCFGGGVTWRVILNTPELAAAVPFYGPIPPDADLVRVPSINAPVFAVYGGEDTNVNARIPAMDAAMKASNKVYEKMTYPGAQHAFFNDQGPRYHPEASKDAWDKTLVWFDKYLRA